MDGGEFFAATKNIYYGKTDEKDEGTVPKQVEEWDVELKCKKGKDEGEDGKSGESSIPRTVLPPFMHQDTKTVKSTPSDKVEGSSMP